MVTAKSTNLELAKKQIQIEIINSCIAKSKNIAIANAAKWYLRNAYFFIARFRYVVPNTGKIKETCDQLDNAIYDLKRSISIMLYNLIGNRPIFIEDLFWFSTADLKSGYVLLYPNSHTTYADNVLFLTEAVDPFDNTIYFPGDIKSFRQVNHVLSTMKGLSEKELGICIKYASKTEVLKELAILKKSINKSTK
jgi:hypothetical protein